MGEIFNIGIVGLEDAIKEAKARHKWIAEKKKKLVERLIDLGLKEAKVNFTGAYYDGDLDAHFEAERVSNFTWRIHFKGKSVCFIEFGAGVHYNSSEPYPIPRPEGIVGIGEYGKGHGKQDAWYFTSSDGKEVKTYGNPAEMPMYKALIAMQTRLSQIAKEVFEGE